MMENMRKLFMKDWFFIPLMGLLCAGVFGTTHLFLKYGTGTFNIVTNNIYLAERDWLTLSSMGIGIYLARVLEGPMVGLMDIGGGVMAGVGGFVVALVGVLGFGWIYDSFILTLLVGLAVGLAQGAIVILIRKLIPDGISASGTDIMMGIGHQISSYMGPLFIICALQVSIPVGIAACIGGAIAHLKGSNVIGGIVIGMFLACFIWA